MNCYFDHKGNPKVKLVLIGENKEVEIDALVDTGFNGSLMLTLPLALMLGLKLISSATANFADGSFKNQLVFEGKVKLKNKIVTVDILLTEDEENKMGIALLKNNKLTINFSKKIISIS